MELKVGQTWTMRNGARVEVQAVYPNGEAAVGNGCQVFRVNANGFAVIGGASRDLVSRVERVYIAGPMTGLPGLNFEAFHIAAANYRAKGCHVENPAEINPDKKMPWADCMRKDIPRLLTCESIAMLPGWEASRGATLEHDLAKALEMTVTYLEF